MTDPSGSYGRNANKDPVGIGLLTELATELLAESARVHDVMAGQFDPGDLVARYILAQGVTKPADFQLPEPILHPFAGPEVLVVGFNPNFGLAEDIPRYGSSLEDYVAFYADRFADHRRDAAGRPAGRRLGDGALCQIGHYDEIEQLIAEALGTSTAFGHNTVYCDAIPWKWKQGGLRGYGKAVAGHAYLRLERIVLTLKPRVVLTLGKRASEIVGEWTRTSPVPGRTKGDWPVIHVASYHPGAWGNIFERTRESVKEALQAALD